MVVFVTWERLGVGSLEGVCIFTENDAAVPRDESPESAKEGQVRDEASHHGSEVDKCAYCNGAGALQIIWRHVSAIVPANHGTRTDPQSMPR